ncbi:hypothetical protein KXV97_002873 [Aspergillus fumigatus]|nr:hypothetical protein KXV97_002873 [Aspergillus fumigatus]
MQLMHFNNAFALFAITCSAGPIAQFAHKLRDLEQSSQSPGHIAYSSLLPLDKHVLAALDEANGGLDVIPITPSVTADGTQTTVPQASYASTEVPGSSVLSAEGYLGTVAPLLSPEATLASSTGISSRATVDSGSSSSTEIPASSILPAEGYLGTITPLVSTEIPLPSSAADSSRATADSGTSSTTEISASPTPAGEKHSSAIASSSAEATLPSSESSVIVIPTTPYSHSASHPASTPSVYNSTTSTSIHLIKHRPTAEPSSRLFAFTPISIVIVSPSSVPASTPTTTPSLTVGVVGPLSGVWTASSSPPATLFATALSETPSLTPTVTETATYNHVFFLFNSIYILSSRRYANRGSRPASHHFQRRVHTHHDTKRKYSRELKYSHANANANANGDLTSSPASGPTEGAEITTIHATATITKSVVVFASSIPTAETLAPAANTEESESGVGSRTALTTATVTSLPFAPYRDPGDAYLSIVPVTPGVMTVTSTKTETETETVTKTERETVTQTVTETLTEKETVILRGI